MRRSFVLLRGRFNSDGHLIFLPIFPTRREMRGFAEKETFPFPSSRSWRPGLSRLMYSPRFEAASPWANAPNPFFFLFWELNVLKQRARLQFERSVVWLPRVTRPDDK